MLYIVIDGALFMVKDGAPIPVPNGFIAEREKEAERQKGLTDWRNAQREQQDPYFNAATIWGASRGRYTGRWRFHSAAVTRDGSICYTMKNALVTALFRYDPAVQEDRRLFHKSDFHEEGMTALPDGRIVVAMRDEKGVVDLALFDGEMKFDGYLTGGDSIDQFPAASLTDGDRVLYSSRGIARTEQGVVAAFGPSSLFSVAVERREVVEMAAEPEKDLLLPKEGSDGSLYYIRSPYDAPFRPGLIQTLKDALLFPVHLLFAIFGFLTVFVKLFDRRPPKPLGPQAMPPQESAWRTILGKTVDTRTVEKNAGKGEGPALVPRSWELVRRSPDGAEEVIARNVAAFDLAFDGTVYFTNGYKLRSFDGKDTKTILKEDLIERVFCA